MSEPYKEPDSMPSSVTPQVGGFDKFAEWSAIQSSRAWVFVGASLLIVVWGGTYWMFSNHDTWQLIINTTTTVITFLLAFLILNAQRRADLATQHKLNAMSEAMVAMMRASGIHDDVIKELRIAVGLEERESA